MSTRHIRAVNVRVRQFATQIQNSVIALTLLSVCPLLALAQDGHSHTMTPQHQEQTPEQKSRASALIKIVRESTERYKDVSAAEADGYALQFGCVSGPDSGAMGLHFVNGALVNAGVIDATRPQIVIYEPTSNGGLKLIGADYLVLADAWDKKNQGPPELMGQLFHYFEAPNRFGLPAFYTLHVWAWKDNPNGAFVNWHPNVSCEQFGGQVP
ncbi:MAG: hypothetical protein WA869_08045 [Alloacidobacterium sp.]|jgi:hypothetical protein